MIPAETIIPILIGVIVMVALYRLNRIKDSVDNLNKKLDKLVTDLEGRR